MLPIRELLKKNKNSHDFLRENFYKFITNHQQYMLITLHVLTKCLHVGWPGSWWYAVGRPVVSMIRYLHCVIGRVLDQCSLGCDQNDTECTYHYYDMILSLIIHIT